MDEADDEAVGWQILALAAADSAAMEAAVGRPMPLCFMLAALAGEEEERNCIEV